MLYWYSQSYVDKKKIDVFILVVQKEESGSQSLFTKHVAISTHVVYQGGNVWFFNVELLVILVVGEYT